MIGWKRGGPELGFDSDQTRRPEGRPLDTGQPTRRRRQRRRLGPRPASWWTLTPPSQSRDRCNKFCWGLTSLWLVEAPHRLQAEVPPVGNGPLVVLLGQQHPDEAEESLPVREDSHHVRPPLHLLVETLERLDEVSRIELGSPHDFVGRAFAYGNTFALVDQHRRTLYTELEGPPVIARAEEDRVPAA